MRMDDPIPTFSHLVEELKRRLPKLAYLHAVAPGAPAQVGPEDQSVSGLFRDSCVHDF